MPVLSDDELAEKLAAITQRLRDAFEPCDIYVFGSYVHGTPQPHSDIDLVVVVEDSALTPYQRDARAYRALRGIGVPKDVLVYTREEFERRSALSTSFERTVRSRGRLLHVAAGR